MGDRNFTYRVNVDTSSVKAAARDMEALFADSIQQIESRISTLAQKASMVSVGGGSGRSGIGSSRGGCR